MKNTKGLIFTVLYLISIPFVTSTNTCLLSNKGKQFTFGFMANEPGSPITLRLSISTQVKTDVNVSVTTPLFDPSYQYTLSIRSGQVKEVTLSSALQGSSGVENKGIYVEADGDVFVYAFNTRYRSVDDFLVLPNVVLGNEYYVMSWSGKTSLMVVITEDFTNLNLTLGRFSQSVTLMGSSIGPGESMSVIMRKFETLSLLTSGGDFTGTRIYGNTSFAVFGGSVCGNVGQGGCDHLAEQMLPVDRWGKEFITLSMPGCASQDWFKIVGGFDNTIINISGTSNYTLTKSGDFYVFTLDDSSFRRVSSDKPISLFMFSSGNCETTYSGDPSMLIIPALSQYSSNVTFSTNSSEKNNFENYVAIVIDVTTKKGLRFDGSMLPSLNWFSVYGQPDLVYTEISVSAGDHSLNHLNGSVKFLAFAAGIQTYISYSYLLGIDFLEENEEPIYMNCVLEVLMDAIDDDSKMDFTNLDSDDNVGFMNLEQTAFDSNTTLLASVLFMI